MSGVFDELCLYMKEELNAFSFLSKEDVEKLPGFFQCRHIAAGETLWKEDDECSYLAFIVSGRVQIKKETEFKGNKVILGVYGKGAFVGALCILDGSPRSATAEAIDDTAIVIITKDNFDKLTSTHPEIGNKLMKGMLLSVSKRLKGSFDRLIAVF